MPATANMQIRLLILFCGTKKKLFPTFRNDCRPVMAFIFHLKHSSKRKGKSRLYFYREIILFK